MFCGMTGGSVFSDLMSYACAGRAAAALDAIDASFALTESYCSSRVFMSAGSEGSAFDRSTAVASFRTRPTNVRVP
jgi:hypothetical protein